MQTKDDEIIELYWKRDPKAIEETQTHYGEKLGRLSFGILENSAFQIHAMKIRCRGNRSDRI